MTLRAQITLALGALVAAYAFGRYTAPDATVITKEVVKIVDATHIKEDKHVKVVEVVTELPDGTKKTERVTTDESVTTTDRVVKTDDKKSTEVIPAPKNTVHINVLAGMDIKGPYVPLYGASVTKEILGPISVGVWGLTNGVIGVSAGLSF